MPKKPLARQIEKRPAKEARASVSNESLHPQQPLVSGRWLLTAMAVVVGLAAICAYATLCLLFYQGSWQLIFHPSRTISTVPESPYQAIQFDYTETGKPQLTGWWIPAADNARHAQNTILILHDGRGSLSDTVSQLQALHALGINIFTFDYRGFGKSADLHPSETSMTQDAEAALTYLTQTRHLPAHSIVMYGTGLGASIAASTSARRPEIPALILENIGPDASTLFAADARTKILPVRLLTSDRFRAGETLKNLRTPKLIIQRGNDVTTRITFDTASEPKQFLQVAPEDQTHYLESMRRFLDGVLP